MSPDPRRRAPALDAERWLASPWGRWVLALLLVLTATTVTTALRYEFMTSRGGEVDATPIFLRYLFGWLLWVPVGVAALALSRWLMRRSGSFLLVIAVNLPLSVLAGLGMVWANQQIAEWIPGDGPGRLGERGFGGPPEGRGDGRGEARPEGRGDGRGARRLIDRRAEFLRRDYLFRGPRELFLYWFVLGLGAGVGAFLRTRQEERRAGELELRAARLRARLADAQLSSLQAQLHPHFLFNALHAVGGLVRAGDQQAALKTLAAIGELLRITLDHGERQRVPLRTDLAVVRRYLEIEAVRLGDRLAVGWDVDDAAQDALVPALFLLPLVENAVRHGIAPRTEGGRVEVCARRAGERLEVEVEDDGPGFPDRVLAAAASPDDAAPLPEEDGRRRIGLENTRARLAALYPDAHAFELSNREPRGASVRVVIPFRTSPGEEADA